MTNDLFEAVPTAHRHAARLALANVLGGAPIAALTPVSGGASGASVFRVEGEGRRYLMRIEGPEDALLPRNPHRHACTRLAADAGVAPAVHHLDEVSGVMVTDFIEHQPLQSFPGGALGLARAVGELLNRLQALQGFPQLVYYPDLLTRMLGQLSRSDVFAPGLLDRHVERLAGIRAVLDRQPASLASSHNDPHPGNILFDGARLWLIDWETAYRNHPLVDVAIALDNLAATPDLEEALIEAWLGRPADDEVRSQLALVRPLPRLYYACFLLNGAAAQTPPAAHSLGKLYLDGFLTGAAVPPLADGG